jgi:hypothetical protein
VRFSFDFTKKINEEEKALCDEVIQLGKTDPSFEVKKSIY